MTFQAKTPRVDPSRMANAIRALAMDAVEKANSGHPGLPMGAADIATVLFTQFLKFDARDPKWADRDRFVLSAGHGSMLLYALLYLTGNEAMTIEEIKNFRQLGSLTPGHPENFITPGIDVMDANASFLATDGMAAWSFAGVVFSGVLFRGFIWLFDKAANHKTLALSCCALVPALISVTNASIFTTLLTNGAGLLAILIYLYSRISPGSVLRHPL